jgi:hypothetical protein
MQGSMAALINRGRGNEKNKPICCQWRERERERERAYHDHALLLLLPWSGTIELGKELQTEVQTA